MFSEEQKEQKINEKFAEKYGLSIEQLNKAAEEEYEKLYNILHLFSVIFLNIFFFFKG